MNDVITHLLKHRSIRRFTDAPVPDAHIEAAVVAGQAASTSSARQAYHLLQVTDPAQRARLVELTGGQKMVAACGAFFVVSGDSRRHRVAAEEHGLAYDTALESFLVAAIDGALFAQNVALAFESMGYGICYVGGLRNQLSEVRDLLSVPAGMYPLFGLCVGIPDQQPIPRPRLPVTAVWSKGRYPDRAEVVSALKDYDATYRDYLVERGAPRADWSHVQAKAHAAPRRTDLAAFYRSQGAHLD